MLATTPWYSTSDIRVASCAGMGAGVIENRDWPLVRRGSTQSVAVDDGKAACADWAAPIIAEGLGEWL